MVRSCDAFLHLSARTYVSILLCETFPALVKFLIYAAVLCFLPRRTRRSLLAGMLLWYPRD